MEYSDKPKGKLTYKQIVKDYHKAQFTPQMGGYNTPQYSDRWLR